MYALEGKRVWVAGHRGMVGSAVVRRLESEQCTILTATRSELDLTRQAEVERFVADVKPDAIVVAAAKVGGILANDTYPADFLYENLLIETAIFGAAHAFDVQRLLFLGSSCIYPKLAPQPITEDALLTGPLEETNEALRDCQDRRHQAGAGVSQAVWPRLHLGDAHQPLRAGRQLRPEKQPRAPGADPQGA